MLGIMAMALYAELSLGQTFSYAALPNGCPIASPQLWIPYDEDNPPEHRPIIRSTILRSGSIIWFGKQISQQQLTTYLGIARQMRPEPYIVVQYEPGVPCSHRIRFRALFELQARCGRSGPCSEREMSH